MPTGSKARFGGTSWTSPIACSRISTNPKAPDPDPLPVAGRYRCASELEDIRETTHFAARIRGFCRRHGRGGVAHRVRHSSAQAPTSGSASQEAPTSAATGPSKVNIAGATISYLTPTGFEKAAREAATEFNQRFGATVNFTLLPTLELRDKLLAEYAAKTGAYDVVNVSPWWIGAFGQYFEPLDQY